MRRGGRGERGSRGARTSCARGDARRRRHGVPARIPARREDREQGRDDAEPCGGLERLERRIAVSLEPFGLQLWGFDVLATLRRHGEPFRLTPTALSRATMLTTGAMTNRLDRLESAGFVAREPDPNDRRGVLVALTPEGRELVDRALEARFAVAEEAVAGLSAAERAALEPILASLLGSVDDGR